MNSLGKLCPGEHLNSLGVTLFLRLLDEGGVHVRGLEDLAVGGGDQVEVDGFGGRSLGGRAGVGRIFGLHEGSFEVDVDLLGGRSSLPQTCELVEALLLGGLGKGGVLGGSASLACNGGLQVLERGARFGGGIGDSIEVAGVLSGGKFGTKVHNVPLSIVLVNCFVNLILLRIYLNKKL